MRTSPNSLFLRALVALIAVVVLAAGCGSDSESADTGDESGDSTQSETSPDDEGDDDASDDTASDDGGHDDSDMDEEDSEPSSDLSTSTAIYCEANAANDDAADNLNPADSESVRMWIFKTREALRDVIPRAPEEIRGDLATLFEGFEEFIVILEAHEFDFFAALPEIDAIIDSPAQVAAVERLDAWEAANCPTESAATSEENSDSGNVFEDALATPEVFFAMIESEGGRELILDGMTEDGDFTRDQAECLIDHPDFLEFFTLIGGEAPSPDIIPTIIGVFSECGIDLESLGG